MKEQDTQRPRIPYYGNKVF